MKWRAEWSGGADEGRQPKNPGAGPGAAARGIAGGLRW